MSINDYYIVKTRRRGYGFWKTLGHFTLTLLTGGLWLLLLFISYLGRK